jgi:spermidine synthase
MLNSYPIHNIDTEKYKLFKNYKGEVELHFKNYTLSNSSLYPIQYSNIEYINGFAQKVKQIPNSSKVLVLGLGLGLIPYYLKDTCEVEIVEIDSDLINIIKSQNYIPDNITIHHSDAYNFEIDKIYDWVVVDIFWDIDNNFDNNVINLKNQYLDKVTSSQNIYFPITL